MTNEAHAYSETGPVRRRQPMSPEAIRRFAPPRTPLGRRGYDPEVVDRLLSRVALEVEGYLASNAELRGELHKLRDTLRRDWYRESAPERDTDGGGAAPAKPNLEAVKLMSAAQQQADTLLAQAREYARQVASQARQHYNDVLQQAQQQAQAEAERAALNYRAGAGPQYAAEIEELERRLAWARAFLGAVQGMEVQLRTVRESLEYDFDRLTAQHELPHRR